MATAMAFCAVFFGFASMWFGAQGSALHLARDMVRERRRGEVLQLRNEAASHAIEIMMRIIDDLLAGRLCLKEAIVQVQGRNRQLIEKLAMEDIEPDTVAAYMPPPTDPENVGRQILIHVRTNIAPWPPEKAKRLLADLEREFRDLFGEPSCARR
ncbi:MAG TPA: hypothetical protein VMG10_06350 [Gemmataceae bacterium]|nr:hypothetical protein [Gemmataceae bacterium]